MGGVRVYGFGGLRFESPLTHRAIPLAGAKSISLLFFLLAQHPDRLTDRGEILRFLWPDTPGPEARHRLRQVIHSIRRVLGAGSILGKGNGYLAIDHNLVWSDLQSFRAATERKDWSVARDLYRGDLLPGFDLPGCDEFNAWFDTLRSELQQQAEETGWRLAHSELNSGDRFAASQLAHWAASRRPRSRFGAERLSSFLIRIGDFPSP